MQLSQEELYEHSVDAMQDLNSDHESVFEEAIISLHTSQTTSHHTTMHFKAPIGPRSVCVLIDNGKKL
jgi:hypothetical protein